MLWVREPLACASPAIPHAPCSDMNALKRKMHSAFPRLRLGEKECRPRLARASAMSTRYGWASQIGGRPRGLKEI